jgi:hypothetical protein
MGITSRILVCFLLFVLSLSSLFFYSTIHVSPSPSSSPILLTHPPKITLIARTPRWTPRLADVRPSQGLLDPSDFDQTVLFVFDPRSIAFSYVSFFYFVFHTLPYSTIRHPHAVATSADLTARPCRQPPHPLLDHSDSLVPHTHLSPRIPYDTTYAATMLCHTSSGFCMYLSLVE